MSPVVSFCKAYLIRIVTIDPEGHGGKSRHHRHRSRAGALTEVDGASLAVIRMALGGIIVFGSLRSISARWAESLYGGPDHRFTYLGTGWVPRLDPSGVTVLLVAVALAGTALGVGWRTRWAAVVVLVGFTWIELLDATTYLNHYWFVTLLAAIAVVAPLGATWSLDARRRPGGRRPRPTVAVGWVWLVRFQVGVVYVFAGLAKLRSDWLVRALPLRLWLPARSDVPLVGPILELGATAHVLSIAGAAFDCAIVPLLLVGRTRLAAWSVLVAFHLATWLLFPIGVFPWLMIAAATVFFPPAWPRTLGARLRARPAMRTHSVVEGSPGPAPRTPTGGDGSVDAAAGGPAAGDRAAGRTTSPEQPGARWRRRVLTGAVAVWLTVQVALPLRHLAYPGDHRWTAEGYRFGWNVLLVERIASVTFVVRDPATGRTWTADPEALYTRAQVRVMNGEPDLIHQAARTIAAAEARTGREVEVRVDAWMSFNGRPPARWIDPTVDLAAEPRSLWSKRWILPPP